MQILVLLCCKHIRNVTTTEYLIVAWVFNLMLHFFSIDVLNDIPVPRRPPNIAIRNRHRQPRLHNTRLPSPPSIFTVRIHFERWFTTIPPSHDQRRHQCLQQPKLRLRPSSPPSNPFDDRSPTHHRTSQRPRLEHRPPRSRQRHIHRPAPIKGRNDAGIWAKREG